MPRLRRTLPACGLAIVALGASATTASAAWTPPTDVKDQSTGLTGLDLGSPPDVGAVVPGDPGVAAVVGGNADGSSRQVATHRPNGPWQPAEAFGNGDDITGSTGAVASPVTVTDPDTQTDTVHVTVARVNADGTRQDLGGFDLGEDDSLVSVEALPDGTALVAVTSDSGALTLWHRTPAGAWTPQKPVGDTEVTSVDVSPASDGRLQAVWTTAASTDGADAAVQGIDYGPSVGLSLVSTLATPSATTPTAVVGLVGVDGAAKPSAAWTQSPPEAADPEARAAAAADDEDDPPQDAFVGTDGRAAVQVTHVAANDQTTVSDAIASSDGGIIVAVTSIDADGTTVAAVPASGSVCTASSSASMSDLVRRGDDTVLVGVTPGPEGPDPDVTSDGTLSDRTVTTACGLGEETTTVVPAAADVSAVLAATDGEGSIVAALSTDDGAVVRVDDRTDPSVGTVTVPAETRDPNAPISATPSDSWGLGPLAWTIDDSRVYADTAQTTLPDATAGSHRIRFVVKDAAGNDADVTRDTKVLGKGGTGVLPPPPSGGGSGGGGGTGGGTGGGGGGGTTTSTKRPRVRILSFRRTSRGWVVRVRARGAAKLRISVYRAPFLKGTSGARRKLTCPATGRKLPRPPVGLRGRKTIVVKRGEFQVRLTGSQAKALRRRGRYVLRVAGIRAAPSKAISLVAQRRVTVC